VFRRHRREVRAAHRVYPRVRADVDEDLPASLTRKEGGLGFSGGRGGGGQTEGSIDRSRRRRVIDRERASAARTLTRASSASARGAHLDPPLALGFEAEPRGRGEHDRPRGGARVVHRAAGRAPRSEREEASRKYTFI
jgi:hypothetical protein